MITPSTVHLYNGYHGTPHKSPKPELFDMSLNQQLDLFLREQQKQAYAIALMNTRQEHDALDVVQEAMFAFVNAYKLKPQEVWRPLFYRILQNKINDHHRKQKSWFKHFFSSQDSKELTEHQVSSDPSPLERMKTLQQGNELIDVIKQLPAQQNQVVIYRHWQQMSVAETAHIMQISEGSVKTHLFRATQKIKHSLGIDHE